MKEARRIFCVYEIYVGEPEVRRDIYCAFKPKRKIQLFIFVACNFGKYDAGENAFKTINFPGTNDGALSIDFFRTEVGEEPLGIFWGYSEHMLDAADAFFSFVSENFFHCSTEAAVSNGEGGFLLLLLSWDIALKVDDYVCWGIGYVAFCEGCCGISFRESCDPISSGWSWSYEECLFNVCVHDRLAWVGIGMS